MRPSLTARHLCLALLAPGLAVSSPARRACDRAALDRALDAWGQEARAAQKLVGLAAGVVLPGGARHASGWGRADLEEDVPVDPERTLFRWASISKTATAVVALRLADAGGLHLDAPLARYLDGYRSPDTRLLRCRARTATRGALSDLGEATRTTAPDGMRAPLGTRKTAGAVDEDVAARGRDEASEAACSAGFDITPLPDDAGPVTLRHLLSHTAGIQGWGGPRSLNPPPSARNDPRRDPALRWSARFAEEAPLWAPPGELHLYTSSGYVLLGAALEAASEQPFEVLLQRHVAGPARLESLTPGRGWEERPTEATGYRRDEAGRIVVQRDGDISWKAPAGGLLSTPSDLTRYCAALADDTLLTTPQKRAAFSPARLTSGTTVPYGLGFRLGVHDGRRWVGHDGVQAKTRTQLRLYPDERLCLTLMTNSTWANTETLLDGLEAVVRGWREANPGCGGKAPEAPPPPRRP